MRRTLRRGVATVAATIALALPAAVLLVPMAAPPALAQPQAGPQAVVQRLDDTLLDVMRNAGPLGYQGRYDRLAPVLTQVFDFATMARFAVGPAQFDGFTEAQKTRLVEAFTRMSLATYAARFDGYSGEQFTIAGEDPGPRGAVVVRTQLIRTSAAPVQLNYLLRQNGGTWRILDVFLGGTISELSRQRSEYGAVLQREGFDGLITAIEQATTRLARGNAAPR